MEGSLSSSPQSLRDTDQVIYTDLVKLDSGLCALLRHYRCQFLF
jgi:hypothetical protein